MIIKQCLDSVRTEDADAVPHVFDAVISLPCGNQLWTAPENSEVLKNEIHATEKASRTANFSGLVCAAKLGYLFDALKKSSPHGTFEKNLGSVTSLSPRHVKRYRDFSELVNVYRGLLRSSEAPSTFYRCHNELIAAINALDEADKFNLTKGLK